MKYKGIRNVRNLFELSIDEDYKTRTINNAFNGNYIEYESKRDKYKTLLIIEIFTS